MKTLTRSLLALAILAAFALLTGCGSSSGSTPVGVQITVSVSASPTSINEGQTSTITATVSNDSSNAGVTWSASAQGCSSNSCLTNATPTSVTYNAPASFNGSFVASITATSKADTTVTNAVQITVTGAGVSVTANPTSLTAGQASNLTATVTNLSSPNVTWSVSPSNYGTLGSETSTTAVYTAPTTVTGSTQVTITATSTVNTKVFGTATITVGTVNNVADLIVDGGLFPTTNPYPNGVFASATICEPGSTTACVTVDHLLVDTGSFGVRILQSQLGSVALSPITSNGQTLNDCVQFADLLFLWGEVAPADVHISGETASSLPIHVVADPSGGFNQIPTTCSNGVSTNDQDTQAALLANGILGIGPEPADCIFAGTNLCTGGGSYSTGYPYYLCSGNPLTCQSTEPAVPTTDQVTNPIVLFATDNNGSSITFPSVGSGEPTAAGTLTFGIGTQSNNGLGTATVYTPARVSADLGWAITTDYSALGLYLPYSFIDSGSNAYYIPDPNDDLIAPCPSTDIGFGFLCPASPLVNQTATNTGANNATGTVTFEIDSADSLFATGDFAFATLAAPSSAATDCTSNTTTDGRCAFDWGMPFFYGKTVFTSIDCPSSQGFNCSALTGQPAAPWWAY